LPERQRPLVKVGACFTYSAPAYHLTGGLTVKEDLYQFFRFYLEALIRKKVTDAEDKYLPEELIFPIVSKEIKRVKKDLNKLLTHIESEYREHLAFSKEDRYPLKWMLNDSRIAVKMERYKYLCPILNYLFNINRRIKGDEYKAMMELSDGYQWDDKHDLCVFVADDDFYSNMEKVIGCSKATIKKYFRAFIENKILMVVSDKQQGRKAGRRVVYADGYYTKWGDKRVKHHFLNEKDHKDVLQFYSY